MKKVYAPLAVAVLAVALPVLATTTWTSVAPATKNARCVKGANPTATGTDPAPVTSTVTTDGLSLRGIGSLSVLAETQGGGNMTAGGKFLAYVWNPATGKWHPVSDGSLDLTASAVPTQAWSGFTVTADYGRIAYEPSGVGTTTNVYLCGTSRDGQPPTSR